MIEKTNSCTISFFLDMRKWSKLLTKIAEFLDKHSCYLSGYQISYCHTGSISINLSLFSEKKESLLLLASVIDKHFNEIFKKERKPQQVYQLFWDVIQQDRVGICDNVLKCNRRFQSAFSSLTIAILNKSKIDKNIIFSFSYYLHLILIKVFITHFPNSYDFILDNYCLDFSFKNVDIKVLHSLCEESFSMSYEMVDEIFSNTTEEYWVNDIKNLFDDYVNIHLCSEKSDITNERIQYIHQYLMSHINHCLGIKLFLADMLRYFITQVTNVYVTCKPAPVLPTLAEVINELKRKHCKTVDNVATFCTKIDNLSIPIGEDELRLFVVARNESLRLPYFFKYYTQLGVDRFFLIDNNSTDNSINIALAQDNVHVFKINRSYKNHWDWMEYFLNKYGENRWCMVVDVDELLYFPYSEHLSLKQLIKYLCNNNFTALKSVLLDIHSSNSIAETEYRPGMNPIDICNYFDPLIEICTGHYFDKKKWQYFILDSYYGGVRGKIFAKEERERFNMTKYSLFKNTKDTYLVQGMHGINGANIADVQGAVMHTKFLSDFSQRVFEEVVREEHFNNASEYKIYKDSILKDKTLSLRNENSTQFTNTEQLVDLGVMKCSERYISFNNLLKINKDK